MVDWSQLQPELLHLIVKRLEARFDILRFRSVCSSWRSSVPPKLYPLPTELPSKTRGKSDYSPKNITINTLYLIRSFQGNPITGASASWLVKIRDGFDRIIASEWDPLSGSHIDLFEHVKMRILNPFSDDVVKPHPCKIIDFSNFQVIELGHEYIGRYYLWIGHPSKAQRRSYKQKVVFLRPSTGGDDDFITLTLLDGSAFLRLGENEWVELENEHGFQDIISFNGKLYAIDRKGITKVIDESLNVSILEHVGSSLSRMFLVKSVDDLLAVEKILSSGYHDEVVGFRVLRMNEEEQKWDVMESLSDRILFLSVNQAVSAAASEFCWGRGNLIFFYMNNHSNSLGFEFVFDLETGTINPVKSCPAYCNLFWPPPQWLTCQESVISSAQVTRNSTHLVPSASPENEYKHLESNLSNPYESDFRRKRSRE